MKKGVIGTAAILFVASTALAKDISDKPQCQAGSPQCVHHVIQEMSKRFKKLDDACDHDLMFSLVYLRTTEKFQETLATIGYDDPESVVREDALFGDYYFRAYDAYHSGQGYVPPAWQIAFDASTARAVTGQGNALLGISAHIQRDLPFVLYDLYAQGHPVSYEDHNLVNVFLAQVEVTQELIDHYDPTYPTGGDSTGIFFWRELAWQNFVALRDAPTPEARALVAAGIENAAAQAALGFVAFTAYPPGEDSSARDQYCASN